MIHEMYAKPMWLLDIQYIVNQHHIPFQYIKT